MPEKTAYHEAAHAFMAVYVGAQVRSVTIVPDHDDGPERHGDTEIAWPPDQFTPRELAEFQVQVALAGPVAEMIFSGKPYHPGLVGEWAADWHEAWHAAESLVPDERKRLTYLQQTTALLYRHFNRMTTGQRWQPSRTTCWLTTVWKEKTSKRSCRLGWVSRRDKMVAGHDAILSGHQSS